MIDDDKHCGSETLFQKSDYKKIYLYIFKNYYYVTQSNLFLKIITNET